MIPDDDGAESARAAEFATLKMVDWFRLASRRGLKPLGNRPPAEGRTPADSQARVLLIGPSPVRLARLHVVEFVVAGAAEVIIAHNMRDLVRASGISRLRWSWPRALIAED